MALALKRRDRSKLSPADVKPLGRAGQWEIVEYDGHEYTLDDGPMASVDIARPVKDDEIRIRERRTRMEYGTPNTFDYVRRGLLAPPGTFERLSAPSRQRDRRSVPIDLLAIGPFAGTMDHFIARPARNGDPSTIAVAIESGTAQSGRSFAAGKAPARGPEAMLRRLEARGIELRLVNGDKLLVTARRGIAPDVREAVGRAERLIVAHLHGQPLRCELDHELEAPEAATIVAVDIAACEDHAAGRAG